VIQCLSYELIPMILGSVLTFTTNLENISQKKQVYLNMVVWWLSVKFSTVFRFHPICFHSLLK